MSANRAPKSRNGRLILAAHVASPVEFVRISNLLLRCGCCATSCNASERPEMIAS